jgi:hypothetical protein
MDKEEKTRAIVVSGFCARRTAKEIIQFHDIKKSTVNDIKKKWDTHIAAGGSSDDFEMRRKIHKRRSNSKGAVLAEDLWDIIDRDPGRSMRSIAKEISVSECTVQK